MQPGTDALAVCIGNVHGTYPDEPALDFDRLQVIRELVAIPLVLQGTSGLPVEMIQHAITLGVTKFNINTEVRRAYIEAARAHLTNTSDSGLLDLMAAAIMAMQTVVKDKIEVFSSAGRAA
jgi:tagatose 1,6-diphosphate aldolase GatY/KbaY